MMQSNTNVIGELPRLVSNISSDPRLITDDPATPIYTCFAKVYTMNPHNKIWLPTTKAVVPVSFYFDKHRSVYRIISYEGTTLVINSTVLPTMTFLKPSLTFGLWSDSKLKTIYGLGFANQAHRDLTSEWFEKIVKAASTLEQCLPLPPPAATAVSVEYEDSDCRLRNGVSGNDYVSHSPRTLYLVDSTIDLPDPSIPYPELLMEDYDIENKSGTSEMAHLALKNIQYEREASKLKQLETELFNMRNSYTKLHEVLLKKTAEGDKLRTELSDLQGKLDNETTRANEAESATNEEKKHIKTLNTELAELKGTLNEQISKMNTLESHSKEIELENEVLKKRLRQTHIDTELSDKSWDNVETLCNELNEKIDDLADIQEKLKKTLPTPAMVRR